ncbi:ras GTPase-activating protein-binding protein 1-like isoform X2 [Lineus longissimus]|uniref:ras GTPase-activating protein-binding protein 1-like isoform X2 n=1 Tax=Lineus longissimus TaxID=88925 RepID=UPI00315C88DF
MVMESRDPDPQCVGREFVRQYYTLLHEAPQQLHRFYSNSSCFIHGGVEKPGEEQYPCRGQADIHEKVMSLKFMDCHAKIRQVDSQATVGNAVVVQVTGELSNNRLPMRRFMQTFVLVQQSPKKYYVHNDIFRYQDEVFHDNDTDTEREEEAADTCESLLGGQEMGTSHDEDVGVSFEQPSTATLSNGTSHLDDHVDAPDVGEAPAEEVAEPEEEDNPVEEDPPKPEPPSPEPEPQEPEVPDQTPGEPMMMPEFLDVGKKPASTFSWAALASKNPGPMGSAQPSPMVNQAVVKATPKPVVPDVKPVDMSGNGPPQPQRAPRSTRDRSGAVRERGSQGGSIGRGEGDSGEENVRKTLRYPDKLQLFVGNLPHNTQEQELKDYFSDYGNVIDLKINTKAGAGKTVPNYGFIVYDSPESVGAALKGNMTKKFRNDHRLNVEEKKTNRPGSGRGGDRGGRGGDRGGLSRGGGPGRGGGRTGPPGGGGGGPRPDNRGGDRGGRGGFAGPRR